MKAAASSSKVFSKTKRAKNKEAFESDKFNESKKREWKYGDDGGDNVSVNDDYDEIGRANRSAFTPGWQQFLKSKEALPIKVGGKVVRTYVEESTEPDVSDDEGEDDEPNDMGHENSSEDDDESTGSFDYISEKVRKATPSEKKTSTTKSKVADAASEKTFRSIGEAKYHIAGLCSSITANPEKALSKRRKADYLDEDYPRLSDLIELLMHTDNKVVEITMLSLLLVFKDICPSYRIRLENEDIQLKKETKKRRDSDRILLEKYRSYITFLDLKVNAGLRNVKQKVEDWNSDSLFGLSAFRCQCELIRCLYHFNFRSILLASVVGRAAQPNDEVTSLSNSSLGN